MRNAIGFLIILWGFSQFFSTATPALDSAARETFKSMEAAAVLSQQSMREGSAASIVPVGVVIE